MAPRIILGVDLGQPQEFTALAAVRESDLDTDGRTVWALPHLVRWPPGTPYPEVVAGVAGIAGRLDKPVLAVGITGVGQGVVDLFLQARLPVADLACVTLTGGHRAHREAYDRWAAPKQDLVAAVQSVLQGRRLRIARGLPEAATLTRELAAFRARETAGDEVLENWRERGHDDLVLAVALAVWLGEFGPPPELNFYWIRRDKQAQPPAEPRGVFPGVRYFAPHNSFQPRPQIGGEALVGCPDFKTQEQAAHFIVALHWVLHLPPPDFTVDLEEKEQAAVEKKLAEFLRHRRLVPSP
jgi:hypothetical protein